MDERKKHFTVAKFITKCCVKLKMHDSTLASACIYYHKFYKQCAFNDYDPYTVAATAIYLATKVEEQHTRLRDIVNVCHRTRHPDKPHLDFNAEFWNLRDTIASCELLMMRILQFQVTYVHPHKYLLHYLMSLSQMFHKRDWSNYPICNTAWAMLKDSYLCSSCLNHSPQLHAIAVLDLALKCCKMDVPFSKHTDKPWWKVFYEECTYDDVMKVESEVVDLYNLEDR